jgi:hypothetical protein
LADPNNAEIRSDPRRAETNRDIVKVNIQIQIGNAMSNFVSYSDDLVALALWPSVASSYRIYAPAGGVPTFRMELTFTTTKYDPLPDDLDEVPEGELPGWQSNAKLDLIVYNKLLGQLEDVDGSTPIVSLSWSSTVFTEPAQIDGTARESLVGWIIDIAAFLTKRANGDSSSPFASPPTGLPSAPCFARNGCTAVAAANTAGVSRKSASTLVWARSRWNVVVSSKICSLVISVV